MARGSGPAPSPQYQPRVDPPALKALEGLTIEEVFIERQYNGQSRHLVIKAKGHAEVRISLFRRPPGEPIGMTVHSESYEDKSV